LEESRGFCRGFVGTQLTPELEQGVAFRRQGLLYGSQPMLRMLLVLELASAAAEMGDGQIAKQRLAGEFVQEVRRPAHRRVTAEAHEFVGAAQASTAEGAENGTGYQAATKSKTPDEHIRRQPSQGAGDSAAQQSPFFRRQLCSSLHQKGVQALFQGLAGSTRETVVRDEAVRESLSLVL